MKGYEKLIAIKQNDILLYVDGISREVLNKFKNSKEEYLAHDMYCKDRIYLNSSADKTNITIFLNEWVSYKVESLNEKVIFEEKDFLKRGVYGNDRFGTLTFKNCTGLSFFKDLKVFIVSNKINEETFKKMLNTINSYILNLSFDFNQSTFSSVERDKKVRTDIEYHIFILIMHWLDTKQRNINLFTLFKLIKNNPHRNIYDNYYYEDINSLSYVDEDVMVDIFSSLDELIEVQGVNNKLANKLSKGGKSYLPKKVLQVETEDTFDTNENRFLKYFINYIIKIIDHFNTIFMNKKDTMINYDVIDKSVLYKKELENLIRDSFLRNVGDLSYIPSNSTVLQRREGYRQFYNYYVTIKSMPKINDISEDLSDIIENKSLDLLYEYYCFFMVANILCNIYKVNISNLSFKVYKNEFNKTLAKKTNANYFEFEDRTKVLPRIKLFYNKNYSNPLSYSKPYDPDITIEIFDDKNNLKEIFIFDAKFKIISYKSQSEEIENGFNFDDITKMHAYKDAIKDVIGAFVLYPGDFPEVYTEKSECIGCMNTSCSNVFNGVGAFPLNPDNDGNLLKLTEVLKSILESGKKGIPPTCRNLKVMEIAFDKVAETREKYD
jgi:predicted component of viral defense system (DUF524 family)